MTLKELQAIESWASDQSCGCGDVTIVIEEGVQVIEVKTGIILSSRDREYLQK